jgi:glycosyl hydrolase family 99/calcineurin-like phosphoesterase family protein
VLARLALACVVLALPAVAVLGQSAAGPTATRLVLTPVADAYVTSAQPSRNFGPAARLRVASRPATRSYLTFGLGQLTRPIARATLRVYVAGGSGSTFKVVSAGARPFAERRVTFRNAPRAGSTGPLSAPARRGRWQNVDVTALIATGGTQTLVLIGLEGGTLELGSRESASRRPRLTVELGAEEPSLPIRAAFYYPWFPNAWKQKGLTPYTKYKPTGGTYDSADPATIRRHIEAMRYGKIEAGIASWWGRGHHTDQRFPALLAAANAAGRSFRWSVYYEPEGGDNPSIDQIRAELEYLRDRYAADRSYLRLQRRFVVFVYGGEGDGCEMAERWKQANTVGAYVVLKVFPRFRDCRSQPDAWHQYAPAVDATQHVPWSFNISPGFHLADDAQPRLARDPDRWRRNIREMVASRAQFQLVTSFNEWGEGTAVESAKEWESRSGYGAFLDALHTDGRAAVAIVPPAPTPAPKPAPTPAPTPAPPSGPGDPVIAAAGDIACDPRSGTFLDGNGTSRNCRQKATSDLVLAMRPTAVLTLGDTQYEDNEYSKFLESFDRSWGRVKQLIRPAPGNHEYLTSGAAGYFQYFGAAAGDPSKGYYSYDLGRWHLIALNSQCSAVGGCGKGSPQEVWLRQDLAAHRNRCVLAYWHHPRFTSGQHGTARQMATIWNDLVEARADLVLTSHNHVYERFDPIGTTPQSSERYQQPVLDPNGIRSFVVGTGGKNLTRFSEAPLTGEVVRDSDTFGVLKLTLHPAGYDWAFVPEPGKKFSDSGTATCTP